MQSGQLWINIPLCNHLTSYQTPTNQPISIPFEFVLSFHNYYLHLICLLFLFIHYVHNCARGLCGLEWKRDIFECIGRKENWNLELSQASPALFHFLWISFLLDFLFYQPHIRFTRAICFVFLFDSLFFVMFRLFLLIFNVVLSPSLFLSHSLQ